MFSETWASTVYLYGSNKRIRASDKARMTPGEESRTGMIKIQRVWELILDVALENTDKARTSNDKATRFSNCRNLSKDIPS